MYSRDSAAVISNAANKTQFMNLSLFQLQGVWPPKYVFDLLALSSLVCFSNVKMLAHQFDGNTESVRSLSLRTTGKVSLTAAAVVLLSTELSKASPD